VNKPLRGRTDVGPRGYAFHHVQESYFEPFQPYLLLPAFCSHHPVRQACFMTYPR